ncbi:uncharacterized protein N7484_008235 [Penicillium longicatenatum]|uniref:uncharacterized protein n=1 Tax=Penicillium longicatenatum TaxID=1561947 RepID=UPI0025473611|nr:uncharacterized protein N7484_008235 [Penicillium longicatenatum]KAJ5640373.1 hypothetical protein N7484_008235 [Penicillium longicatenatum]
MSDVADPSSATDSDASGVSFRPDFDATDDSDSGEASNSSELTTPEPTSLPEHRSGPSPRLKRPMRRLADAGVLPDFSDDPNDDTNEDLVNVPLDYRHSEKTKPGALLKWDDLEEALREVTPNDVHQFFNYYMKLKYGENVHHLKGTSKASALKADWKGFRGYYRRITWTRITAEYSEEINTEPVYIQELTKLNKTILRTQERRFHFRYERIQLYLFNILSFYYKLATCSSFAIIQTFKFLYIR